MKVSATERFEGPAMRFNHLLAYRSRQQLEQLSDAERAALAAEISSGPPSREAWQAVYELFALWPDSPPRNAAIDATAQRLAAWDDALRTIDTSSGALLENGRLTKLARLASGVEIYRREERGGAELTAVASSEFARDLKRLVIDRSNVTGPPWEALVGSPVLGSLRHLHVTGAAVGSGGIRQLFASRSLPVLECLKLIDLGMTTESLDVVRQAIPFPHLRRLDFSRNLLRNAGAELLAQAPWLGRLERLSLRRNFIGEPGVRALITSPHASRFEQLELSDNDVSGPERAALFRLAQDHGVRLSL